MRLKVAVLDMQPITPAVGGGRLRLLGLYHALGDDIDARYIGTYDWPGEPYRRLRLSPTLEEIDVPLSDAHHAAARELAARASGKTVIDVAFHRQCHLSPRFLEEARAAVTWADVVVFSHPWVYPPMQGYLRPGQTVVYDSHNVEGLLRAQLLDESHSVEADLLRGVVEAEHAAGNGADLILACSQEDLNLFHRIYGWPCNRMRVVPNGVMAESITPATPDERAAARGILGVPANQWAGIFVGSDYAPNVEAARFIVDELAPTLPNATFVIAGGVGASIGRGGPNVVVTGALDDATKLAWLKACDFAVNPMFSGSGTNIKMFDFMAAGLPVVATAVGARGIDTASREPFIVTDASVDAVAGAIRCLQSDAALYERTALDARACVADGYAWERISPQLGVLLRIAHRAAQVRRPKFSVVIPSYDRHDHLDALMPCLSAQTERDFEVIVVDQSPDPWPSRDADFGLTLHYFHTLVKGAARARNTGAFLASGEIIAFTDDDCRPLPDWLAQARACFSDNKVVGVEGLIESDHLDDPNYRPVTNVGFEGIGFMTANLLVRSGDFQAIGGFDLAFDRPHFREDTDLGWRLQERGEVPFGRDVRVFHPAQPRGIERESAHARAHFFEKDALLYAKHPERYRRLFEAEGHWRKTPGFWEHFRRGGAKYGVDLAPFEELLDKPLPRETAPG